MKLAIKNLVKLASVVAVMALAPVAHAALMFSDGNFNANDGSWGVAQPSGSPDVVGIAPGGRSGNALWFKNVVRQDGGGSVNFTGGSATNGTGDTPGADGYYLFTYWLKKNTALASGFGVSVLDAFGDSIPSDPWTGSPDNADWTPYYAAVELGGDFTVSFDVAVNASQADYDFLIDDVSFTRCASQTDPACTKPGGGGDTGGNVPEPGTLFLVGAALAAGGLIRRKSKV